MNNKILDYINLLLMQFYSSLKISGWFAKVMVVIAGIATELQVASDSEADFRRDHQRKWR